MLSSQVTFVTRQLVKSKSFIPSRRSYSAKTFSNQAILPKLPIPELEATGQRYKKSLIPLLSATDYQHACAKVDQFIQGDLGKELQQRLLRLDEQETKKGYSWLDQLWLNKGYLEYRAPTMINVNWWMQVKNSPLGLVEPSSQGVATLFQLNRAAGFVVGLVDYSNRLNNEQIPPDVSRSGPFCMHQLKGVFSTTRIAAMPRDRVVSQYPATAKHITVIYKDQIFSVDVIGQHGESVSVQGIEKQLQQVVNQVDATPVEQRQLPIGLFTSEQRDTWANIRQTLESNPENAKIFKDIETSLFALCLDDYSSSQELDEAHRNMSHGRYAFNRWFDKGMQVIVETNGAAGINGEHSPVDAVVPLRVVDDVLSKEPIQDTGLSSVNLAPPRHLTWSIDNNNSDSIKQALQAAEANSKKSIDDLDCVMLHNRDYGSDFMKRAKISPDSWMQMVFQLAYYRHYGQPCPTYESASTRKFLTGRTETVRSCSEESVAFTKTWEDKDTTMVEKLASLEKAIASHSEYMRAASNGQGVDRHLFGLYYQMTPEEAQSEQAGIFRDPIYRASQYWKLSTSNTSPGTQAWGAFGPVVTDGYGINYAIDKEMVRLSVSSCRQATETDSASFRKTIHGVMTDFAQVATDYILASPEETVAES
ncbi:acyltransferase ChoActase/COT/CPT [Halteromyces radiatus]|uniref:acyltransferase ChoActase/COT/CPT n=1 Tax=Halteromyces radiatus TaxID=101107 RepID=UPI00221EEB95|nr:acyltransferase ChoActase/COT/CPT [Halteromyces radiatus]KAI8098579.1 acyltransferase ChoActase/COT/CPT [Halteromyces radiatus]